MFITWLFAFAFLLGGLFGLIDGALANSVKSATVGVGMVLVACFFALVALFGGATDNHRELKQVLKELKAG